MPLYPPHRPVGALEARAADEDAVAAGVASLVLLEHAGRALAVLAASLRVGPGPVVVVCGPGNNGGDGYACARFLRSWGVAARILRFCGDAPRRGDARIAHDLAVREEPVEEVSRTEAGAFARALVGALREPQPPRGRLVRRRSRPRPRAPLPGRDRRGERARVPASLRGRPVGARRRPRGGPADRRARRRDGGDGAPEGRLLHAVRRATRRARRGTRHRAPTPRSRALLAQFPRDRGSSRRALKGPTDVRRRDGACAGAT